MAGLPDTAIMGPGWGEVLMRNMLYEEHPLPDLRPDLESQANLGLE